jgi:hypothetical protein
MTAILKGKNMLSDVLSDAVGDIEAYERDHPKWYAKLAEEIRKVKLEMMILQGRFDMPPDVADQCEPEGFEWVRAEALRRGAERPSYEFGDVFGECMDALWKKKGLA